MNEGNNKIYLGKYGGDVIQLIGGNNEVFLGDNPNYKISYDGDQRGYTETENNVVIYNENGNTIIHGSDTRDIVRAISFKEGTVLEMGGGNDEVTISSQSNNRISVDGGKGDDTLVINSSNSVGNNVFANISIKGIENIVLNGGARITDLSTLKDMIINNNEIDTVMKINYGGAGMREIDLTGWKASTDTLTGYKIYEFADTSTSKIVKIALKDGNFTVVGTGFTSSVGSNNSAQAGTTEKITVELPDSYNEVKINAGQTPVMTLVAIKTALSKDNDAVFTSSNGKWNLTVSKQYVDYKAGEYLVFKNGSAVILDGSKEFFTSQVAKDGGVVLLPNEGGKLFINSNVDTIIGSSGNNVVRGFKGEVKNIYLNSGDDKVYLGGNTVVNNTMLLGDGSDKAIIGGSSNVSLIAIGGEKDVKGDIVLAKNSATVGEIADTGIGSTYDTDPHHIYLTENSTLQGGDFSGDGGLVIGIGGNSTFEGSLQNHSHRILLGVSEGANIELLGVNDNAPTFLNDWHGAKIFVDLSGNQINNIMGLTMQSDIVNTPGGYNWEIHGFDHSNLSDTYINTINNIKAEASNVPTTEPSAPRLFKMNYLGDNDRTDPMMEKLIKEGKIDLNKKVKISGIDSHSEFIDLDMINKIAKLKGIKSEDKLADKSNTATDIISGNEISNVEFIISSPLETFKEHDFAVPNN